MLPGFIPLITTPPPPPPEDPENIFSQIEVRRWEFHNPHDLTENTTITDDMLFMYFELDEIKPTNWLSTLARSEDKVLHVKS